VTARTDLDGDALLLIRAIRAVVTCGTRTLSGLLHQFVDGAPSAHPDEPKRGVPVALETAVLVVDGPDGHPLRADRCQTVRFALDGQSYEIDLSERDAADFRLALQRYVHSGRRTGASAVPRGGTPAWQGTAASRRERNAAIRQWARAHGHDVSDRGRIPMNVVQAYRASG
jgi:hypothetical protein